MTVDDQNKLINAGFTLARQTLGNKLLICKAAHKNWISFNVPTPPDLDPDDIGSYVDEETTKFLMHPKTILI